MTDARLSFGAWGEDCAVEFLYSLGVRIVARNYRTKVGEIDIIAKDRNNIIFIEVKTRRSNAFGTPQEAVGLRKQRQIVRTAQWYLQNNPKLKLQPRFDVIAILCQNGCEPEITHIVDAFSV